MSETNALPNGYNLHRYQIEGVLGAGGFGITYQAMHEALQNEVAIKEYFPAEWAYRDHNGINVRANAQGQIPARQGEPACYQWGLERFLDEAKILVQINHPGVVRVRDYFTANGSAYIVMEYEDGESLSAMLQRGGILPEPELRRLVDDIMPALEAVHAQNYLHRDLKPSNLYIRSRDGHVMLLDFGAARQALGRHTRSVTSVVTPGYSPIEQYVTVGDDYGPWTDIYALGAVMYRCITGAPPIEAPGRVLKDPVQPAVEVGAGLYSRGLLQVVDQALAVRPEERFQSVVAMQQAINAAEHSGNHADFFQLPPIQDSLLDLPSATPSLRFEPIPPPARAEGPGRSTTALPDEQPAMNWTLDQVSPGGLSPPPITDSDLSLPMLENIWEHLDESAPPAQQEESAPTSEPAIKEAVPPAELSESLLKRSPQSALEHLKKVNTRRSLAESRSSPHTQTRSEAASTPSSAHNKPESPPEPDAAATNTRAAHRSINWPQVLLAVIAVSGVSGVSLLSYEYYQALQEQRQREAADLQRQQEEAEARHAQEAARQRQAEFAKYLEQARKAMADGAWDRANRALTQATALDAQNPALATVRAELLAAQNSKAAIKTRTDALTGLELHWIEGGCFNMGSPPSERDRSGDESVHEVCVKGFWIGKTEVTNQQFRRFKSTHDSGSVQGRSLNGDQQPAVNLNWEDAQAFAEWLTWEIGTDQRFRLPTEAEWEYAARAGAMTRYYWGNDIDPRYANFSDRNDPTGASVGNLDDGQAVTAPVGTYLPNLFGLHDTAGNVWEWTCSEYLPRYGSEEQRCSAKRPNEGQRTVRGGSWNNGPGELRSAKRLPRKPGDRNALTGFRVVMTE